MDFKTVPIGFGFALMQNEKATNAFLLRCPASADVGGAPWHLPTAATRSGRFIRRRRRSHRSL